jgi:hypothetical protein
LKDRFFMLPPTLPPRTVPIFQMGNQARLSAKQTAVRTPPRSQATGVTSWSLPDALVPSWPQPATAHANFAARAARAYRDLQGRALFEAKLAPKLVDAVCDWTEQFPPDAATQGAAARVAHKVRRAELIPDETALQFDLGFLAHFASADSILPKLPDHVQRLDLSLKGARNGVMPVFKVGNFSQVRELHIQDAQGVMGDLDLAAFPSLERLTLSHANWVARVDVSACAHLREIDIEGATRLDELRLPAQSEALKKVRTVGCEQLPKIQGVPPQCEVSHAKRPAPVAVHNGHQPTHADEVAAAKQRLLRLTPAAPQHTTEGQMRAVQAWVDATPAGTDLRTICEMHAVTLNATLTTSSGKGLYFDADVIPNFPQLTPLTQQAKLMFKDAAAIPDFAGLRHIKALDCSQARGLVDAGQLSNELAKCPDLTLLSLRDAGALRGTLTLNHPHLKVVDLQGCDRLDAVDLRKRDLASGAVPAWVWKLPPTCKVMLPEGAQGGALYNAVAATMRADGYAGPQCVHLGAEGKRFEFVEDTAPEGKSL